MLLDLDLDYEISRYRASNFCTPLKRGYQKHLRTGMIQCLCWHLRSEGLTL